MDERMNDVAFEELLRRSLSAESTDTPVAGLAERAIEIFNRKSTASALRARREAQIFRRRMFQHACTILALVVIGAILFAGRAEFVAVFNSSSKFSGSQSDVSSGTSEYISFAVISGIVALAGILAAFLQSGIEEEKGFLAA